VSSSDVVGDSSGTKEPFKGLESCLLDRLFAAAPGDREEKLRRGGRLMLGRGLGEAGGGEGDDDDRDSERGLTRGER